MERKYHGELYIQVPLKTELPSCLHFHFQSIMHFLFYISQGFEKSSLSSADTVKIQCSIWVHIVWPASYFLIG